MTELPRLLPEPDELDMKLKRPPVYGFSSTRFRTTARAREGSLVDEEADLLMEGRLQRGSIWYFQPGLSCLTGMNDMIH